MKRSIAVLACTIVLFAFTVPPATNVVTVTGKLIDTKCYGMMHDNHNNDHMVKGHDGKMMKVPNCATACSAMGIPSGLLVDGKKDSQVYILIVPTTSLAEHQAKEARVTGEIAYEGAIIPSKIEVKEGKKWVEVKIATMM
jgi:hypothetical protein